jgi:hypothetical protein
MTARVIALLALAALLATWGTMGGAAQTPSPETSGVVVGAYQFDYDAKEPLQAFPIARSTNADGSFVTWFAAYQRADGSVRGLTECDDLAVICAPLISPAKGAFALADPGDAFNLASEAAKQP